MKTVLRPKIMKDDSEPELLECLTCNRMQPKVLYRSETKTTKEGIFKVRGKVCKLCRKPEKTPSSFKYEVGESINSLINSTENLINKINFLEKSNDDLSSRLKFLESKLKHQE